MFSPTAIKVKLKDEALKLGFDDLKVCSAEDFSEAEVARLRKWFDNGFFDKMEYLKRGLGAKISPRKFLPEAMSAVCVCAPFWRDSDEKRIALYAQGDDYHDVIKPKLLELAKILEEVGAKCRVSVDASPLWEKLLARRAGLGWIGKNTLIIRNADGAWHFLGVILTSMLLPFDEPIKNRCGGCNACVKACPSGAITEYGIDARKCISNLTIERKGELSEQEKRLVGDKIFGCDECLRACPFGKNAKPTTIAEFLKTIKVSENPPMSEIVKIAVGTPMERKFKNKD